MRILGLIVFLALSLSAGVASAQGREYVILSPDGHPPAAKPMPAPQNANLGPGTPVLTTKNPNVEYKQELYTVSKAGWWYYPGDCIFIDCAVHVGNDRNKKPDNLSLRSAGVFGLFRHKYLGLAQLLWHEEGGYISPFPVSLTSQYSRNDGTEFGRYAKRIK